MSAVHVHTCCFIPPQIEDKLLEFYGERQSVHAFRDKFVMQEACIQRIRGIRHMRGTAVPMSFAALSRTIPESPIEIWDATKGEPGKLVISRTSGSFDPDVQATTCYANMKNTDEFSRCILARNPVSNATRLMKTYIHHTGAYNNAYWNPSTESVYFGEVDPEFFRPFVENHDVESHEFGHAITEYTANLRYKDQSGSLNESMSDVFAIIGKHFLSREQADSPTANWLIGDGLIVNDRKKGALRSMQDPGSAYDHPILGKDSQPRHMRDYLVTTEDNGGVHTNSGIPNHAFYLAASRMGGYSWEKAGLIWHRALLQSQPADDFSKFAGRTIQVSKDLKYAEEIQNIVSRAWHDVGIDLREITKTKSNTTDALWALGILIGWPAIWGISGYYIGRASKE